MAFRQSRIHSVSFAVLKIMRLDIKITGIYHETSSPGGRTGDISSGSEGMRRIPLERIYHPARDPEERDFP